MIRKYQSFFESITIKLSIEKALKNFCETLIECEKYLRDNSESPAYSSYSYVAQESKGDIDPEINFREIDEYMSKNGWNLKTVKELVDSVTDFADKIERKGLSHTAAIDYYLYKITEKEFHLQGYEWDLIYMDDPNPEINEFLIKFSYGWHKTRYGKLVILQNMKSIEEFILASFKNLPLYIIDNITSVYNLDYSQIEKEKIVKNFFFDKEINEIYIDSDNLFTELKELRVMLGSRRYGSTREQFLALSQTEFDNIIVNMLLKATLKPRIIASGDIKVKV
jgi:hypothetical protein